MFSVDVSLIIWYIFAILCVAVSLVVIIVYKTTSRHPDSRQYPSELCYKNPNAADSLISFPSLKDPGSIYLSVIIPAYDEAKRRSNTISPSSVNSCLHTGAIRKRLDYRLWVPPMLDECLEYLEDRQRSSNGTFTYELIIVDDGSKDDTSEVGIKYCRQYGVDKIRILTLQKNRGKGGAVTMGMMRSRGLRLLFADADGATTFSEFEKLESGLQQMTKDPENVMAIAIGSRAHLEKESIATRSAFRTILMHGFHFLVWLLCVRSIRDTQCGFKLLSRAAARSCFPNLHIHRWAFDVELLYIAESLNIPMQEVAVKWMEIEGSKLQPFWSWLQMGRDLGLLWLRYRIGAWKIDVKRKLS